MTNQLRLKSFIPVMGLILAIILLSTSAEANTFRALTVPLEQGNLLSIIEPYGNSGEQAKAARTRYYDKALTLAREYGFQNRGALRVTETLVGEEQPTLLILATWPNLAADDTFEALPQWQEYKALRPIIWRALRFYKSTAQHAMTLTFEENKAYTLSLIKGSTKSFDAAHPKGSKLIHRMDNLRFVTHSAPFEGPDEVLLMEWQDEEALASYAESLSGSEQVMTMFKVAPVFR